VIPKRISRWLAAPLRPIVRWAVTNAFDGLSTSRRGRGWQPENAAINALLTAHGEELRMKSRDAVRRNAWATNAVDSFVGNAIGTGIVPQSKHPDPKTRERIHRLWLRWTDESDADGMTDFYGQQSLACRGSIEAGEMLARRRFRRPSDGLSVPLQIQLLEPEHLPFTMNEDREGGVKIRGGIEFSPIGKRNAYHLYRDHPNDILNTNGLLTTRISASEVSHLYKPLRAGQHRGQPWLTPVLGLLYDLEKYESAELMRKQMAAMMAFFITKLDPNGAGLFGDELDTDGTPMQGIEPGSVITLDPNEDVKISEPADVGGSFESFLKFNLRKFAAGLGITYEQATGDLAGVTYSSIRAGLLEFRRRVEQFQHQVMVFQFCRPIWRPWIEQAVLVNALDAVDYAARPEAYLDVDWCPQAWPWVDPLKDIEAEVLAVDNLLKSRTESIKETGRDAEDVDAEIEGDQKREEKLKLKRGGNDPAKEQAAADQKRKQLNAA
jgi:lambda family phage portal protein